MTTRSTLLRWLELALLAAGIVVGSWTVYVAAENWYYARLPVPVEAAALLPGEDPSGIAGTAGRRDRALERGSWVARLEIPAVDLTATVLEGSDDRTLRRAAGHIEYTPLPGGPGNVGVAGHRDTVFRPLRRVAVGDLATVTTADRVLEFKVTRTWVVAPEEVAVLDDVGRPVLTLVTCYPFDFVGSAPQRFIVRAELVAERPR